MRSRFEKTIRLIAAMGAAALLTGCASQSQTTESWAVANGYQRVAHEGKDYFCHAQPVTERNPRGMRCVRIGTLRRERASIGPAPVSFSSEPINPPQPGPTSIYGIVAPDVGKCCLP